MQYLLTQEEYDDLKKTQEHQIQMSERKLQDLCTKIANEMPVKFVSWGLDDSKPWGCILNKPPLPNPEYCDECPVSTICPKPYKEWSK